MKTQKKEALYVLTYIKLKTPTFIHIRKEHFTEALLLTRLRLCLKDCFFSLENTFHIFSAPRM